MLSLYRRKPTQMDLLRFIPEVTFDSKLLVYRQCIDVYFYLKKARRKKKDSSQAKMKYLCAEGYGQ